MGVEAAFRKHFHRTVDHKSLRREARQDVWECVFLSAVGKEHKAHLSKKEFEALELKDDGSENKGGGLVLLAAFWYGERRGQVIERDQEGRQRSKAAHARQADRDPGGAPEHHPLAFPPWHAVRHNDVVELRRVKLHHDADAYQSPG